MKKGGGKKPMGKPKVPLAMPTTTPEQSAVVSIESNACAEDERKLDEALRQYAHRDLHIGQFQFITPQGQMTTRKQAILGRGTYGDVYRMRLKSDRTPLAVKTMRKDRFFMTEEIQRVCKTPADLDDARKRIAKARSRLLIEIAVLQELTLEMQGKHDHLLAYHATFFDKENVYIVMELSTGVELFQYLAHKWSESKGKVPLLPRRDIVLISSMLLEALQFIHAQGIIHRDVKLENILVKPDRSDHRYQLKLIDFGQAKYTRSVTKSRKLDAVSPGPGTATTPTGNSGRSPLSSPAISVTPGCGSMIYLPIEALSKIVDKEEWLCTPRFATKLDIYACGMTILIMLRGPPTNIQDLAQPATENESPEQERERHRKLLSEVQSSYLYDELDKVDTPLKPIADLAKEMLHINPERRPTTEECLRRLREIAPTLADRRDVAAPLCTVTLAASVVCNVVYGAVSAPEITPPTSLTLPAGLSTMRIGAGSAPVCGSTPLNMSMPQTLPVDSRPGIAAPHGGGISLVGLPQRPMTYGQPVPQAQLSQAQPQPQMAMPVGGAPPFGGYSGVMPAQPQPMAHVAPQPQQHSPYGQPMPMPQQQAVLQPAAPVPPPQQQPQPNVVHMHQWNPYDTGVGQPFAPGPYGQPMAPQQGQTFTTASWIACMRAHDEDAIRQAEGA